MFLIDMFCSLGNGWNNQWLMLAWLNINSFLGDKHPQSWHWLCSKRIELCGPWRMTLVEHKGRIIFLEEILSHFFQIISMSSLRKGSIIILSYCREVILKSMASSEEILKGKNSSKLEVEEFLFPPPPQKWSLITYSFSSVINIFSLIYHLEICLCSMPVQ